MEWANEALGILSWVQDNRCEGIASLMAPVGVGTIGILRQENTDNGGMAEQSGPNKENTEGCLS